MGMTLIDHFDLMHEFAVEIENERKRKETKMTPEKCLEYAEHAAMSAKQSLGWIESMDAGLPVEIETRLESAKLDVRDGLRRLEAVIQLCRQQIEVNEMEVAS